MPSPSSSGRLGPADFLPGGWIKTWVRTALIGTTFLVAFFGVYEIVERVWLLELVTVDTLFDFHIYRGVGASVILGSWSFYNIWKARSRFDLAFRAAYKELERAMNERTRALAEAQSFNERLFQSLRDRIVVLDRNGIVVKANHVAKDLCGSEDLEGKSCSFVSGCAFGSEHCVAEAAFRTGGPVAGSSIRRDASTGRIWAIEAYPVPDADGKPSLVIETARDVTDEKRLETQLRNQEKHAALGMLAAGIAHDIANPLNSMSSELEMLEGETDLDRIHASTAALREQVGRIARTLREMTDFARRRGEDVSAISVDVAVNDALRMVRHDRRARRVRIETELDPELPELRMVEDHLVMVLVNLFLNAFDAMPEGGGLCVRAFRWGHQGVEIAVSDTGAGMSPEVRRQACEPLFTTKTAGRGTGLGLSVASEVVKGVGGTLEIESEPGVGTTVRLQIPGAQANEPQLRVIHG